MRAGLTVAVKTPVPVVSIKKTMGPVITSTPTGEGLVSSNSTSTNKSERMLVGDMDYLPSGMESHHSTKPGSTLSISKVPPAASGTDQATKSLSESAKVTASGSASITSDGVSEAVGSA